MCIQKVSNPVQDMLLTLLSTNISVLIYMIKCNIIVVVCEYNWFMNSFRVEEANKSCNCQTNHKLDYNPEVEYINTELPLELNLS
jgi:hypothetical protein